ncbi:hypothetical protein NicSoilC12_37140 [Arthrobacter sp. NicSoilC12]|nr:hypothetical protein NicSoilC12_37140 [Arthrobacter sp. NicSoilC12]VXB95461.1 hypothetical protein ARTHRO8AJ_40132 [Arthrobacter sp. 8AJ]
MRHRICEPARSEDDQAKQQLSRAEAVVQFLRGRGKALSRKLGYQTDSSDPPWSRRIMRRDRGHRWVRGSRYTQTPKPNF